MSNLIDIKNNPIQTLLAEVDRAPKMTRAKLDRLMLLAIDVNKKTNNLDLRWPGSSATNAVLIERLKTNSQYIVQYFMLEMGLKRRLKKNTTLSADQLNEHSVKAIAKMYEEAGLYAITGEQTARENLDSAFKLARAVSVSGLPRLAYAILQAFHTSTRCFTQPANKRVMNRAITDVLFTVEASVKVHQNRGKITDAYLDSSDGRARSERFTDVLNTINKSPLSNRRHALDLVAHAKEYCRANATPSNWEVVLDGRRMGSSGDRDWLRGLLCQHVSGSYKTIRDLRVAVMLEAARSSAKRSLKLAGTKQRRAMGL